MAALSRMLYVSRKKIDANDPAAVSNLMRQSGANNTRDHVTGLLSWSEDAFLQVVEGPRSALCELLWRLHQDPRHEDLRLIEFRAAAGRIFPTFSLAVLPRRAGAGQTGLTYEQIQVARPDELIRHLTGIEPDPSLSIVNQLGCDTDVVII